MYLPGAADHTTLRKSIRPQSPNDRERLTCRSIWSSWRSSYRTAMSVAESAGAISNQQEANSARLVPSVCLINRRHERKPIWYAHSISASVPGHVIVTSSCGDKQICYDACVVIVAGRKHKWLMTCAVVLTVGFNSLTATHVPPSLYITSAYQTSRLFYSYSRSSIKENAILPHFPYTNEW